MDYTGLYGWINGEYLDGVGWVPDEDYVPVERPWYVETTADSSDDADHVTFVSPYLDEQTGTVLTTMAKELSDGESVVALDVTLSRIEEITKEVAYRTPGSMCLVRDGNGQVIAHSESSELGRNLSLGDSGKAAGRKTAITEETTYGNCDRKTHTASVGGLGRGIAV